MNCKGSIFSNCFFLQNTWGQRLSYSYEGVFVCKMSHFLSYFFMNGPFFLQAGIFFYKISHRAIDFLLFPVSLVTRTAPFIKINKSPLPARKECFIHFFLFSNILTYSTCAHILNLLIFGTFVIYPVCRKTDTIQKK